MKFILIITIVICLVLVATVNMDVSWLWLIYNLSVYFLIWIPYTIFFILSANIKCIKMIFKTFEF